MVRLETFRQDEWRRLAASKNDGMIARIGGEHQGLIHTAKPHLEQRARTILVPVVHNTVRRVLIRLPHPSSLAGGDGVAAPYKFYGRIGAVCFPSNDETFRNILTAMQLPGGGQMEFAGPSGQGACVEPSRLQILARGSRFLFVAVRAYKHLVGGHP